MAEEAEGRPVIEVSGLRKRFRQRGFLSRTNATVDALQGVDLRVPRAVIHGVIGPNGSGKSTLLRILATLVLADGGRAWVAGHDVEADAHEVRRSIGFSTGEERSLYWRLTARENLEFAAALRDLPDPRSAIDHALEVVDLAEAADRRVSGFSQGMARRLSLARAMLHRPAVLLLDEPARSLDPVGRDEFHEVLLALRRHIDTTVLLTTHDMGEAVAVCDAVSVLQSGRVVEELVPRDEAALVAALRRVAS